MILVTGANGFIGKRLVETLLNVGKRVRATDLKFDCDYPKSDLLQITIGNICDPLFVSRILENVTTTIHLAAVVASPDETLNQNVNVVGTANLLAAVSEERYSRFVYISAAAAKFTHSNAYGRSKHAAEILVKNQGIEYAILRIPLVIGAEGKEYSRFVQYVKKIPFIVPIFGNGKALKRPIYIDDVVYSILTLIGEKAWPIRILELASSELITFDDLVDIELMTQGTRKWKIHVPKRISLFLARVAEVIFGDRSPITRDIVNGINENVIFDTEPTLRYLKLSPKSAEVSISLVKAQNGKH